MSAKSNESKALHARSAHKKSSTDFLHAHYFSDKFSDKLARNNDVSPSPVFIALNRYPVLAVYANQLLTWDTKLCIHINRYSTNQLTAQFFKVISRLGDGWFWYILLLMIAVTHGRSALLPLLTTSLISLSGLIIYKLLKIMISNIRYILIL